jgi:glycosyltransferase involved in cell wall biosynthesis
MRVLYCTDTYPPQINGVSIVTSLSAAGLHRRGWDCAVLAPRYPADAHAAWGDRDEGDGPAPVSDFPSFALPGYPEVRVALPRTAQVIRIMEQFPPDLVHCETEFGIGRAGHAAARRLRIPVVSSYHTDFSRYAEAYRVRAIRTAVERFIARHHRRSLRVYTPSMAARTDLLRLGVREVEVWGRGVDTERFHPGRRSDALRAALGMGSRFTFLHVGRLASEKRPEQVIEAYQIACTMVPRGVIHLVIAGTGPREAALRTSAPPGVTFLGVLDRQSRLPDLYANADAFVFTSVTETLGLVVLEAMASGLPVIAVPAGGVADHLRDGRNGMACREGDVEGMARAMVTLATEWEFRHYLARGARRTAEGLGWETELDRLDLSYREVLARAAQVSSGNQQVTVVPLPRSLSA